MLELVSFANRRRWPLAGVLAVVGLLAPSCERNIEGAPCPCIDGWTCCLPQNRCYASPDFCGEGDAGSSGAPAQGGVSTAGGDEQSGHAGAGAGSLGGSGGARPSVGGAGSGSDGGQTATGGTPASAGTTNIAGSGGAGGTSGVAGMPSGVPMPRFCNRFGWCGDSQPFHAVWGSSADDVWVIGSDAASGENAFLHWDGQRWTNTPHPDLALKAVRGVWGTDAEDVWFVGSDGASALATHWGGSAWSMPAIIEGITELRAVRGISQRQVYAVGTAGGLAQWNGGAWSKVETGITADLHALWTVGPNFWAVGDGGTVLQWDGRGSGTTISVEIVSTENLRAVWGTSEDDVWVAGEARTLLHWDGQTWTNVDVGESVAEHASFEALGGLDLVPVDTPAPLWLASSDGRLLYREDDGWHAAPSRAADRLRAVWTAPSGEVWAVGDGATVLHFDAKTWFRAPEALTPGDLFGVWGAAPNDVWAVGDHSTILHWDGSVWSRTSLQFAGDWRAISGTNSRDIWAVGTHILHFDGNAWSIRGNATEPMLRSVCANAADDAWAVGDAGSVLRWDGNTWRSSQPFPSLSLKTVWCFSKDDVWAIDGLEGIVHWDGRRWSLRDLPRGTGEIPTGQALMGSASDDVWLLTTFSRSGGDWLRRVQRQTGGWNAAETQAWSGSLAAAYPTARNEFWLAGTSIWYASLGALEQTQAGTARTVQGIWAPDEPVACDELGLDEGRGPNGSWAVGSEGLLLDTQCLRWAHVITID